MSDEMPERENPITEEPDMQEQEFVDWYIPDMVGKAFLAEIKPTPDSPVSQRIAQRQMGVYDQMIHRTVDGPDPLVQEPKAKE